MLASLKFDTSLSMQETSADAAASLISSLVSENIGGLFWGDNPLSLFTRSLSLRNSAFKLAYFLLSFLIEVSIFTYFTVVKMMT